MTIKIAIKSKRKILLKRKGEQLKTNAIYDRNLLQNRNS